MTPDVDPGGKLRAIRHRIIAFRVWGFILYNLSGGYVGMNRQELIIMLTVLAVGVCIIVLILANEL